MFCTRNANVYTFLGYIFIEVSILKKFIFDFLSERNGKLPKITVNCYRSVNNITPSFSHNCFIERYNFSLLLSLIHLPSAVSNPMKKSASLLLISFFFLKFILSINQNTSDILMYPMYNVYTYINSYIYQSWAIIN